MLQSPCRGPTVRSIARNLAYGRWPARLLSKSILSLPRPSRQVTRFEISTLKRGKKSSTLAADALQIWIAVVSTSVYFH
jgi:hypothetical protein